MAENIHERVCQLILSMAGHEVMGVRNSELDALRQSLPRLEAAVAVARSMGNEAASRMRAQWGTQRSELRSKLSRSGTCHMKFSMAGTASITVAAAAYTDAAGNEGGSGAAPSITLDTLAPTLNRFSAVRCGVVPAPAVP